MKICVAQTRAEPGDISHNIDRHLAMIDRAAGRGSDVMVFPELSVSGYEPSMAVELACEPSDKRFDPIEELCWSHKMTVGIGVPINSHRGVQIATVIFQPDQPRRLYTKVYIHTDEEPFFVPGRETPDLYVHDHCIAPAICYEISVPEHAEKASARGADIYLASVAKDQNGVEKALQRLAGIAEGYSMATFMSNCVGTCDGDAAGGRSSVWNKDGVLLAQLGSLEEGIVIYDTANGVAVAEVLEGL